MRFTLLGAATALAAVGQAFLIPPTITSADKDIVNTLPFADAVNIQDRIIQIECPGCPVVVADVEGKMHSVQVENVLRLNFSLSLNEADQLMLNGHQIYPIDLSSQSLMQPLEADQLIKSPAGTWQYASSPKLGYSLSVRHPLSSSNNENLDLIAIHVEIIEVADTFVNGVPSIDLKLLQTPSGKLMIGDAQISPARSPVANPTDGSQECTNIICKWKAIIADKLSKIKGCAGKARPGAHGSGHGSGVRPHGHGGPRPHSDAHHSHRPHRNHHMHGGLAQFLRNIILHVFIPIMIGVIVGVTTSLVGMIVGHLIVFIWRALFRRGQRGQYTKVQQEDAAIEDGDDEEHQLPPPSYEEAPVYEDAVAGEKASE